MSDGLRALPRLHSVLRAVAAQPEGLGFNELRRRLDQTVPATLSRLLKGLVAEELLLQVDGRYAVGPALTGLARLCLGPDRQAQIEARCAALATTTGASVSYHEGLGDGWHMRRLAKHEVDGGMHYGPVGDQQFVLAHGHGIPLAAAAAPDHRAALLARHAVTSGEDPAELAMLIGHCRTHGVVARTEVLGDNPLGCTRLAALVSLPGGGAAGLGLTLLGRADKYWSRAAIDRLLRTLNQHARRLSADLETTA